MHPLENLSCDYIQIYNLRLLNTEEIIYDHISLMDVSHWIIIIAVHIFYIIVICMFAGINWKQICANIFLNVHNSCKNYLSTYLFLYISIIIIQWETSISEKRPFMRYAHRLFLPYFTSGSFIFLTYWTYRKSVFSRIVQLFVNVFVSIYFI
jgi:hypothetical protein